ncbi:serine/threonine-protein kinase-like protein CCR1 [Glycine soja]|uniref:non-specific serine/threonine protein kinase n=1 Tax=Glycine soja TaxID=3848 RepID=A0A445HFR9_GLYSO|nr:serine/threonine-protein kinase-like protein CCR1 [Glycine soja]RZB72478.1 Serine/threonine-protein kinase-like protein CCR1 [Glycine soja]
MQIISHSSFFLLLLFLFLCSNANGFGAMGPISASFGKDEVFCSIDASGKQDVICWGSNATSPSLSTVSNALPAMSALSGGEGFLCGILANTSQAFCWSAVTRPSADLILVPPAYRNTAYSQVAAGKSHVCAIRGSYYADRDSGTVDCWEITKTANKTLTAKQSDKFIDQLISNLEVKRVVSGEGFTCGEVNDGGLICWGPTSENLGNISNVSDTFAVLAAGRSAVCGVFNVSGELKCWGDPVSFSDPPLDSVRLVSLSAGANHFCGVRMDNHEVECWGDLNSLVIPKGNGFMAIASSDFTTCGIREDDLLLVCWLVNASKPDFDPPLELSSPGLCRASECGVDEFAFNVSVLNELALTSVCVREDLRICSPCGSNCSKGFFLSSECTRNADRVCTACSLCQNSSCFGVCGLHSSSGQHLHLHWHHLRKWVVIVGCPVLGFLVILLCGCLFMVRKRTKKQSKSCIGKPDQEEDHVNVALNSTLSVNSCPGAPQVFRLSELKDATNGFKEFNELGRGSYGFVYKAALADGRVVAVKRANAATIIHTNNRDFETELEILCKIRHCNVVNLLGYCAEMGERLLVYEYMPHGTLYDHLHGGLSPLNWSLRLKTAMQAAKGLEYLHKELVPPIVHKDLKSSNILLDSEWGARISDFGLLASSDKDLNGDLESDVYNFGIVLLEILSGRKAYDRDYTPPNVVEWAVPLIKQGKGAAIIDRYVALPRNVEPLLKLADIAELAVRENPSERPPMSDIASWLEQIVKDGLFL